MFSVESELLCGPGDDDDDGGSDDETPEEDEDEEEEGQFDSDYDKDGNEILHDDKGEPYTEGSDGSRYEPD